MNRKRQWIVVLSIAQLFLAIAMLNAPTLAQAPSGDSSSRTGSSTKNAGSQETRSGQLKIGILPLTDATGSGGGQAGPALSRMIQAEFTHSTDVIAYALALGEIRQEDIDAEKAISIGRSHHVDAVILGTVMQVDASDASKSGTGYILGQWIGGGVRSQKATVTFQADLFSVATGAKLDSFRVTGTDTQKRVGPSASTRLGDINNSEWNTDNNPLAKAIQKAVSVLVKDVAADRGKIPAATSRTE